jgi:hypothetical protein
MSTGQDDEPGLYQIRLRGHLDQAALHGLLHTLRDTGLPLVSVTQVEPDRPDVPPIDHRPARGEPA